MRLFTVSNFITLSNLICGCLGILAIFTENDLKKAGLFIVIALILDFFDGFVARLLKESSELGKQLDSLADMVSFGALPGFILFKLLENSDVLPGNIKYLALAIPVFSALRLAKFNIDTRQSLSFIGVPTPANAVVIAVLPFLIEDSVWLYDFIHNSWFLVSYIVIFSYLLVAEIPLPALKFKNFGWADNKFQYSLISISVILLVLLKLSAIPVIIFGYILYSIIQFILKKSSV